MTQEINTQLTDKVFYTSPTKKIHTLECRHCNPNSTGWQKISSILTAIDEGYQICRLCCPSAEEIEIFRQTVISHSGEKEVKTTVTSDSQTSKKKSKATSPDTSIESTEAILEKTTVTAKKTNQQKKADKKIVGVKSKETDSHQSQTESSDSEKTEVNPTQTEESSSNIELKTDAKTQPEVDKQSPDTESISDNQTKSQQKAKNKGKKKSSDNQETVEANQTEVSTKETDSATQPKVENQSDENKLTSDNQTKSKKQAKNQQKSTQESDNQTKKDKNKQKSAGDKESKSKEDESSTAPKEKKRYKILAGNGAHQAIAEIRGMLVPPAEEKGKFMLILPDGVQLEVLFRNPRLKWLASQTNSIIGQHWFRGYPKMQDNKLVAFQIIAWDGNMPTNQQGWEMWEFIGVWTLQKNITVQRTMLDEEIRKVAKETGFIKKFKYSFNNADEWMKSKKLWVGYVYKLICRREGDTLKIQKVIPFACPRFKPRPPGSKPPQGKGDFKQQGGKKLDGNRENYQKKPSNPESPKEKEAKTESKVEVQNETKG